VVKPSLETQRVWLNPQTTIQTSCPTPATNSGAFFMQLMLLLWPSRPLSPQPNVHSFPSLVTIAECLKIILNVSDMFGFILVYYIASVIAAQIFAIFISVDISLKIHPFAFKAGLKQILDAIILSLFKL
jgi:hypothetical protein